jgi:hypothetical protein
MSAVDNFIADAKRAKALTEITELRDMLDAAKWANPNLLALVRRYPSEAREALQVVTTAHARASDLVVQGNLATTRDRLQKALDASTRAMVDEPVIRRVLDDSDPLVIETRKAAQSWLDANHKGGRWSLQTDYFAQIEQKVTAAVVAPLVEQGKLSRGVVRVWLAPHPDRPGTHHEMVVQSVRLEVVD